MFPIQTTNPPPGSVRNGNGILPEEAVLAFSGSLVEVEIPRS